MHRSTNIKTIQFISQKKGFLNHPAVEASEVTSPEMLGYKWLC
jgi:hypothetical protein